MRQQLEAQVVLPEATVELRSYKWDHPEARVIKAPTFRLSRAIGHRKSKQYIRWRLPDEEATRPVGRLSLMPANSPILVEVGAGSMSFITCVFPPARFRKLVAVDRWTDEMTVACLEMHNPFIESLLDRLAGEIRLTHGQNSRVMNALITLIAAEMRHVANHGGAGNGHRGTLTPWQMDRLLVQLKRAPRGSAVKVADLAARCLISPRHLDRRFKETTGETIHGYVRRFRLERAKSLLAADHMLLKDIAAELGFRTKSHFAADFRKQVGCTPSQYRSMVRGT
jgi:AraC family transcriptional regulator